MEIVAGSILTASFDGVMDRLKSIDWLKYVGKGQVLDQLKRWEKMLRRIYAVLDDAEDIQTTSRLVEIWLTDVKHLAYDLEDVIDELATEVQQCNLEDKDDKVRPSNVSKLLSSCCAAVNPRTVMFNKEMISKIDMISVRLDQIIREKDDMNLHESNRRVTPVSGRPPSTSLVNETKVYGREEDKKAVLKLLEAADGDADVAAIPITGMGGIGKTTLAQLIYNDTTLHYDLKAWVSVGEDFDVLRITNAIFQSNDNNLDMLQVKLKDKLSGKKFLVVLDDVWLENYEQWTLFRGPFDAGAPGSRIIITTRSQEVSLMTAGTVAAHHLKELSYDECLSVFCQHALGATNFDQLLDVKAIGEEIVKRCKGLPLAAKALGGLLRGKPNINAWEEVLKSEIWDLPDKSNILPALRLSYLYLPPHLKRCFAYCSVFPKDYEFDGNELVLLWMAEGFLCPQNKVKQREDIGFKYFDDLLSRSFFKQSNDNKSRYVMHDLIHDLAQFVSKDACFHLMDYELDGSDAYVRHSSFIRRKYNVSPRFECFYKMTKSRTFLSLSQSDSQKNDYDRSYLSQKVLYDLLPMLKCLRVLSLINYNFTVLPRGIGELKHLRFLDLSNTDVITLPESIGKLFNLETLKLHACCKLIELPNSICNLTNLSYLDISETCLFKEMPHQIGNLTSLRMLSKFIVSEGNDGLKITELKKLSKLAGKLKIKGLQNVRDIIDGNFVKRNSGLVELHLEWDYCHIFKNSNIQDEQILNSLVPHQNLSSVSITRFGGKQFPSWVGDPIFTKMVKLQLCFCENIKSLPPLGRLTSLKELRLDGLNAVEKVGSEFYEYDSSFPCLESLEIRRMHKWKQWSWCNALNEDSVGKFHNLRKLKIQDCPNLVGKLPSFLPSLQELVISGCEQLTDLPGVLPSLKKLYICGCQEAVLRTLPHVPSLTELSIVRIKGLVGVDESYMQGMTSLQEFVIGECDELKYLFVDTANLDYLTSLKHLSISNCKELVSLVNEEKGLNNLKSLERLSISSCQKLISLPIGGLPCSLKALIINQCHYLETHHNSNMSNLERLEVSGCNSVIFSPNGEFANPLKFLVVGEGAKGLLEFPYYGFSHLTRLIIDGCDALESFPEREFPSIPTLLSLSIVNCKRLKSLSSHMQSFHCLQSLSIHYCDEFESLPERGLPSLSFISLSINCCHKLRSFPNWMQNLTSLRYLDIEDTGILSLKGCLPPNLTQLKVSDCENLKQPMAEWGLHTLASLRKFTVALNTEMVNFPDNEGLLLPTSLTYLKISDFKNMQSISRGIQNLISLRELLICKCPKLKPLRIETLPLTLEFLDICNCPLLEDWCSKDKGEYGPIVSYRHTNFII